MLCMMILHASEKHIRVHKCRWYIHGLMANSIHEHMHICRWFTECMDSSSSSWRKTLINHERAGSLQRLREGQEALQTKEWEAPTLQEKAAMNGERTSTKAIIFGHMHKCTIANVLNFCSICLLSTQCICYWMCLLSMVCMRPLKLEMSGICASEPLIDVENTEIAQAAQLIL